MGTSADHYTHRLRAFLACILCVSVLCGCAFSGVFNRNGSETESAADISRVQRLSYNADSEYEKALEKLKEGCAPARIARDEPEAGDREVALVIREFSDRIFVEKALEMLEAHHIKAAFAVTAMEASEDAELLKRIRDEGHEIIDAGAYGDGALDSLSDEELLKQLTISRKVFTTLLDLPPAYCMYFGTEYTDSLCEIVSASGCDRLILPSPGHYLNGGSFKTKKLAGEYVNRLSGRTILVYRFRGAVEPAEYEPGEEHISPAKDKQATVEDTGPVEEATESDPTVTLKWILDSMMASGCRSISVTKLKAMTAGEYAEALFAGDRVREADVIESISTLEDVTALSFIGLPADMESAVRIAGALGKSEARATFFVSPGELEEKKGLAEVLKEAYCSFALRPETGAETDGGSPYDIYRRLAEGRKILHRELALRCRYILSDKKPGEDLLRAAGVAGMDIVCPPGAGEMASRGAERGKIRFFELTEDFRVELLEDHLADAKAQGLSVVDITELLALDDLVPDIPPETLVQLRSDNEGRLAPVNTFIYTGEKAVGLIFSGISNEAVLKDVLSTLEKRKGRASFFVTFDEMHAYPDSIRLILEKGHELGIAYAENKQTPAEFDAVAAYILKSVTYCEWKYGVTPHTFFQLYGTVADETREAVSAAGFRLAGYEFSMVQSADEDAEKLEDFYGRYSTKITAHRGSVAYFRMNYYRVDQDADPEAAGETLLGNLLRAFISGKVGALTWRDAGGRWIGETSYSLKSYAELAGSPYVYTPGRGNRYEIREKNTRMADLGSAVFQNEYMIKHYIGNPNTTVIPGFDDRTMAGFDTAGLVTEGNDIYLTFDDWGEDRNINGLLYVLKKYGVKASFFVRTETVDMNPNLLRAIALDGHMIGSHSHTHIAGCHSELTEDGKYVFESLTDEEAALLRKDVVKSYRTLNNFIGDVKVGGRPALSLIYRPPTLAVSRIAMYNIFDVGYKEIVSGEISTAYYDCRSLDELLDILRNGKKMWYGREKVKNGSVLVMHMSNNAAYTADALDIMIPEWIAQGYTFGRLDDHIKDN